jgi:CheY-like chemotaxis protein
MFFIAVSSRSAPSIRRAFRAIVAKDDRLPDYDGYFLMQSLSETPELAGVPVIVLTTRDRFTHEGRCHDAGA